VVSVVRRMDEVNPRRAQLVLGWVTSSGGYTISVCNHTTRLTQPCIPPGSLNRVPARLAVKAGMSPLYMELNNDIFNSFQRQRITHRFQAAFSAP